MTKRAARTKAKAQRVMQGGMEPTTAMSYQEPSWFRINFCSTSTSQTLLAQRDLAVAESSLAEAETLYEKSRIDLERAVGSTLETHNIQLEQASTRMVDEHH